MQRIHRVFIVAVLGLALLGTLLPAASRTISRPITDTPESAVPSMPNIIVIIVDALRADHTSAYGYARSTTPHLDALIASQGARFDTATSAASWTFPGNASMLTGQLPSHLGVVWFEPASALPTSTVMLAEYLRDAGYYTAGFITAYYMGSKFGFAQGFDHYFQQVRANAQSTRAAEINQAAMDWIDTTWTPTLSGTQPLFLYLYYFDPHTWYDPPPPYNTLYDPTYTGTLTTSVYADSENVVNGSLIPSPRDVEHVQALYDGEIAYCDEQLGALLNFLDARQILSDSLIIVTSDHGEMFGEHGKWTHFNSVYEEALRVPLLMRYTGVISAGVVVTVPVQTTDITPSILDWLGLTIPAAMDGHSLKPLTQGAVPASPRRIFSEIGAITNPAWPGYWLAPRYEARAVRQGNWKYIHYLGLNGSDALYGLLPASVYETDNVIQAEPEVAAELDQLLVDQFKLLTLFTHLPVIAR